MAKKTITKKNIQQGFQDYLLTEGKVPETVRIFTNHLKISDEAFFEHFGSLKKVESSIWEDYYQNTISVLQKDPDFEEMTDREKHLSFLYTLLEVVKKDRSYIQYRLLHRTPPPFPVFIMNTLRIIENAEIEWITPPKFIPEKGHDFAKSGYRKILWKHSLASIHFWAKDDSPKAEDTDAFVEKTTRTLFDLGHIPALDSVLDLGKFFLQRMGFSKASA